MKWKLIKRKISAWVHRQLKNKKTIVIGLALVLTVGGTILTYKNIKMNKQDNIVVKEFKKEEFNDDIYLEAVNTLKSELVNASKLSFCETQIRVSDTFGYNKDDNITLESVYDVAFTIDMSKVIKGIKNKKDSILVSINREDIYLYKCEQVSDIKILDKKESLGNKLKDVFKNDDADLLHKASNRLNVVAKEEANKAVAESDLRVRAEDVIADLIESIVNIDVEIQINDNVGGK